MRRLLNISFLVLMVGVLTAVVAAQPPAPDDSSHRGFRPHKWGKMSANVENLRMLKLLETLDLSEEQSEKFVPIFHSFRKDNKALLEKKNSLIDGIKDLLANDGPDDQIIAELNKLKMNRSQSDTRQEEFFSKCQGILTTPQYARLIIFHERFEREMLESLREFRHQQGMRSGMNRPGKI